MARAFHSLLQAPSRAKWDTAAAGNRGRTGRARRRTGNGDLTSSRVAMCPAFNREWRQAPERRRTLAMQQDVTRETALHAFVKAVHGVRYQVKDVARSAAFYTQHLGFTLTHQQLPAFASVALGDAQILLSGPGASGSRPMPDGQPQEPGGWNRVVLKVADLSGFMT